MNEKKRCPLFDLECPCIDEDGYYCTLENPNEDCDDYYAEVGDEDD